MYKSVVDFLSRVAEIPSWDRVPAISDDDIAKLISISISDTEQLEPENITDEEFNFIQSRIMCDLGTIKSNWYDGEKYTNPQGDWCGWECGGYIEYICYHGVEYRRQAKIIEIVKIHKKT